jgi:hypothetical protein
MLRRLHFALTASLGMALAAPAAAQQLPELPDQLPPEPGLGAESDNPHATEPEALNHGPLHEAFATPATDDPVQGPMIERAPPEPIDEVPPEDQPEGDNIVWIPGYWAFDEGLDDFIWVSGLWRNAPPDREWVPGYWTEFDGGFRWVAGMWVSADAEELTYLPEPPASQEQGPSSPAPGDDYFYVPGIWEWHDVDYRWRPGYWTPRHDDWMWVNARYAWSPGGYVYHPGHWDYLIPNRGFVYAPVHFHGGYHGGFYRPRYVVNTWSHLFVHLFVQPSWGWFTFGNYYGPTYANIGFVPWYQYGAGFGYRDPLYSYYNWRYGDRYFDRLGRWHDYYDRNDQFRPRRTLREELEFARENRDNEFAAQSQLAADVDALRDRDDLPVRLTKADQRQIDRARERTRELRDLSRQRAEVEVEGRTAARPDLEPGDADRADRAERRTLRLPDHADRATREQRNIDVPDEPGRAGREPRPDDPTQRPDRTTRPDRQTPDRETPDREPRPDRDTQPDRTTRPDEDSTPDRDVRPEREPRPESDVREPRRTERPAPDADPTPERNVQPDRSPRPDRTDRETRRVPQPEAQPDRSIQPERSAEPDRTPRRSSRPDFDQPRSSESQRQQAPSSQNRSPRRESGQQPSQGARQGRSGNEGARSPRSGNQGGGGNRGTRGGRDR